MDQYLGEIRMVGFNFAASGWQMANGQIVGIAQNNALFALFGTTYGGNGVSTFGLPDLRGRAPIHQGTGPGLPAVTLGEPGGVTQVSILQSNLPAHTHMATLNPGTVNVNVTSQLQAASTTASGQLNTPTANSYLSNTANIPPTSQVKIYAPAGTPATPVNLAGLTVTATGSLSGASVTNALTGNNIPIQTQSPFLTITMMVAMQGVFPTRN